MCKAVFFLVVIFAGQAHAQGSWEPKAPMPTARFSVGFGTVDGRIYAVGGLGGNPHANIGAVERYDPATDSWTTGLAPMPTPRRDFGFSVANNILYVVGGNTGALSNRVEAYDPATNSWSIKASMPTTRRDLGVGFAAGKLYAIGGFIDGGAGNVSMIEAYDPATNTWATGLAAMPTARHDPVIGMVDGILYAIGGAIASPVGTVEAYDPATNTWTTGLASMPTARASCGVAVRNGRIHVIGGSDSSGFTNVVESYDPATDTWAVGPPMATLRAALGAAVAGDRIYAVGGINASHVGGLRTLESFAPTPQGCWEPKAPMPTARFSVGFGTVNGRIYAVGGVGGSPHANIGAVERYDPATDSWATGLAPMPTPRRDFGFSVANNILYVVGGNTGALSNHVEAYDPSTNSWSTKASMPTTRRDLGLGFAGGKLYAIGGFIDGGAGNVSMIEAYDPATNSWSTGLAPMPTARHDVVIGVIGGIVYAIGGAISSPVGIVEAYDPATNTWTTGLASMPTARASCGVAVRNDRIYVIGGSDSSGFTNVVESYDPATDTWAIGPPMATPRAALGAAVAGDRIHAVGGVNASNPGGLRTLEVCSPNPILIPPDAIVQECDGGEYDATVNFLLEVSGEPPAGALLTVRDVTGNRTLLSQPATAGTVGVGPVPFPIGVSTIEAEITDNDVQLAVAAFTVQIQDTVAPVLSGCTPAEIECQAPQTPLSAELLGISASDACDPNPSITFSPAAVGGPGVTAVTATARDATGNTSFCAFDVTVIDTTAPEFIVFPADIERECDGQQTTVAFDIMASDLCGAVVVSCVDQIDRGVDPSGTSFGIGTHTIACSATDSTGNVLTREFLIRIIDNQAPVIVCPGDITVGNHADECFAFVAFEVTATDLCDPDIAIVCEDAAGNPVQSGDMFVVGTTTVTGTATDTSGNRTQCSFRITVEDREAPVLTCPAAATLVTDCAGSPLTPTPVGIGINVTDNCDLDPTLVVSPSTLAPGTHTVSVTATDDDGNQSSCDVSVTVLKGPFDCQVLRPLDANVDNRIRAGRGIPVKIKVTCENAFADDATVTIDELVEVDGQGTPIDNEVIEDTGAENDGGGAFRLAEDHYQYSLATADWASEKGVRHMLVVRIRRTGHVDTLCRIWFVNR